MQRLPQTSAQRIDTGIPQVDISFPVPEKFDALPLASIAGPKGFGLEQILGVR